MNLGADVNTEGNEIFPLLYEGRLIFSSNGLPGFGGYDLFNANYDHEGVVPGQRASFPLSGEFGFQRLFYVSAGFANRLFRFGSGNGVPG